MSRGNDITTFDQQYAAASAGTVNEYLLTGDRVFLVDSLFWMYETTEANADNTLDFALDYSIAGAAFVSIFANGNPNGLLDTSAVLVKNTNLANAASGGATAIAVTVDVRIPANAVLRFTSVTAGTGTVPVHHLGISGHYV